MVVVVVVVVYWWWRHYMVEQSFEAPEVWFDEYCNFVFLVLLY